MGFRNGPSFVLLFSIILTLHKVSLAQHNPNFDSNRSVIVHLFEWRWNDIAEECERFLGPMGFGGVQTSPANENAVVASRPWWERYQPVSYKLETRSGNEAEFRSMVSRCNAVGVRVYVDFVPNHMTITGSGQGVGTGGSSFNTDAQEFPGVPFTADDFNQHGVECTTDSGTIETYDDPIQVRNCRMGGLIDLNQGKTNVRNKFSEYLNKVVGYGVAGFRVDSTKQMWPNDLQAIWDSVQDLPTSQGFPPNSRAFVYQEIITLAQEPILSEEYFGLGRVTEFKYPITLGEIVRGMNGRKLTELKNFGFTDWLPSDMSLVFVDNHDNQRGHGAGGGTIVSHKESRLYKIAIAFTLAQTYGEVRMMSSYEFENTEAGPPATGEVTNPVPIKPDGTCDGGWICEHRWRQFYHMVEFRNVVAGTSVENWWDNGNNQIAFGRGNKGFIAINNDSSDLDTTLQTGLPSGTYCDIITGEPQNGACTGRSITVGSDGRADILIYQGDEESVVALHVNSKL